MADIVKIENVTDKSGKIKDLSAIDLEVFFNMVWVLAKTADPSIPTPMEWLDSFDEFPIVDILPELLDLIMRNFSTTAIPKKK